MDDLLVLEEAGSVSAGMTFRLPSVAFTNGVMAVVAEQTATCRLKEFDVELHGRAATLRP
jgi:hypothetical protein